MKKRKNSREKGGRGERQVVKALTSWWGAEFFRTPGSGSFATRGYKGAEVDLSGDVVTPDATFPFTVEVKNAEGWHLEQILTAPKCDLVQWWIQTYKETPPGTEPLLVFTRNHQPLFFVMPLPMWKAHTPRKDHNDVWHINIVVDKKTHRVVLGLFETLAATKPDQWRIDEDQ